jgi:hypothetical protein
VIVVLPLRQLAFAMGCTPLSMLHDVASTVAHESVIGWPAAI